MINMSKKIRRTNRIRYKLKRKHNLRLSLFRSNNHIYVQLIDDEKNITITSASSAEKKMRDIKSSPKEIAFKVGEIIGDRISEKQIKQKISFDRGPYLITAGLRNLQKVSDQKG